MDGSTNPVFELPDHAPGDAQGEWPETSRSGLDDSATACGRTSPDNVAQEIQRLLNVAREALAESPHAEEPTARVEGVANFAWPNWSAESQRDSSNESPTTATSANGATASTDHAAPAGTSGKCVVRIVIARMTLDARRVTAFRERELTPIDVPANDDSVEVWVGSRLFARGRLQSLDGHFAIRITERIETKTSLEESAP